MKLAIRTDASMNIGSGHLMRCLCLANALHAHGAEVLFICRQLPDHLDRLVTDQGHRLVRLSTIDIPAADGAEAAPAEEAWSDIRQRQDADCSIFALADTEFDWLVVDHYGLGRAWESRLRLSTTAKLLVIDDLAREHDCDVLLDQNFHPDAPSRYSGRVPNHCQLLLGPRYALLRPEFEMARRRVVPRDGEVRRLVVFLGGTDANNLTQLALEAVVMLGRNGLNVDVVIGQSHPTREAIQSLCQTMSGAHCHVQTTHMANLMATADLAIGAGGSTTWERCALGLPTLALCVAENQREILSNCARQGIVYVPDNATTAYALSIHLNAILHNRGLRNFMSRAGMELVDARGSQRVAAVLRGEQISVRRAVTEDCVLMHSWRNAPSIREMSHRSAAIPFAEHQHWYNETLRSPTRHLLIGERENCPIGVVRFDEDGTTARVSIFLLPDQMGKGEGATLLRAAELWLQRQHPKITSLQAEALTTNPRSQGLFERCGYQKQFIRFSKKIGS